MAFRSINYTLFLNISFDGNAFSSSLVMALSCTSRVPATLSWSAHATAVVSLCTGSIKELLWLITLWALTALPSGSQTVEVACPALAVNLACCLVIAANNEVCCACEITAVMCSAPLIHCWFATANIQLKINCVMWSPTLLTYFLSSRWLCCAPPCCIQAATMCWISAVCSVHTLHGAYAYCSPHVDVDTSWKDVLKLVHGVATGSLACTCEGSGNCTVECFNCTRTVCCACMLCFLELSIAVHDIAVMHDCLYVRFCTELSTSFWAVQSGWARFSSQQAYWVLQYEAWQWNGCVFHIQFQ